MAEEVHTRMTKQSHFPLFSLDKLACVDKEMFTAPFCITEKTGKCPNERKNCCGCTC